MNFSAGFSVPVCLSCCGGGDTPSLSAFYRSLCRAGSSKCGLVGFNDSEDSDTATRYQSYTRTSTTAHHYSITSGPNAGDHWDYTETYTETGTCKDVPCCGWKYTCSLSGSASASVRDTHSPPNAVYSGSGSWAASDSDGRNCSVSGVDPCPEKPDTCSDCSSNPNHPCFWFYDMDNNNSPFAEWYYGQLDGCGHDTNDTTIVSDTEKRERVGGYDPHFCVDSSVGSYTWHSETTTTLSDPVDTSEVNLPAKSICVREDCTPSGIGLTGSPCGDPDTGCTEDCGDCEGKKYTYPATPDCCQQYETEGAAWAKSFGGDSHAYASRQDSDMGLVLNGLEAGAHYRVSITWASCPFTQDESGNNTPPNCAHPPSGGIDTSTCFDPDTGEPVDSSTDILEFEATDWGEVLFVDTDWCEAKRQYNLLQKSALDWNAANPLATPRTVALTAGGIVVPRHADKATWLYSIEIVKL